MSSTTASATESVYVVRDDVSPAAITSSLQALLPTRHHSIARRRFTVLDTFDGRVARAGARLTSSVGSTSRRSSPGWGTSRARLATSTSSSSRFETKQRIYRPTTWRR
jgi:hypothetical protein